MKTYKASTRGIAAVLMSVALALPASLPLTSCQGMLDEKPYSQYSSDTYFENTYYLNMAVLALYAGFQDNNLYGQYVWACFDNDTDVSHVSGTGITTHAVRNIGKCYILSSSTIFDNAWRIYYRIINDANVILDKADQVTITSAADQAYFDRLIAETKFLRAMAYFDLVRFWGDVPMPLTPTAYGKNLKLERTPKAQVYAQIVQDMTQAVDGMPWHDEIAYDGRATKSAAIGMLVKVNMFRAGYSLYQDETRKRPSEYMDYYREADRWAQVLIASGKHELNPDYAQIFKNNCTYVLEPKECIFEIEFYYLDGTSKGGTIGSYNALAVAKSDKYMNTTSYIKTHWLPWSKFEATDLRRDFSIATFSLSGTGTVAAIANANSQTWGIRKWSREWQTADQFASNASTGINYVMLRYADVLLMKAEALNEINNGPTADAYELVNQVRRRGYGKPVLVADAAVDMNKAAVATHDQFLKYLQDERVRELAFESIIRRQDLIRWNILGETVRSLQTFVDTEGGKNIKKNYDFTAATLFTDNKHELYPIPEREMRENKALEQNPGYTD